MGNPVRPCEIRARLILFAPLILRHRLRAFMPNRRTPGFDFAMLAGPLALLAIVALSAGCRMVAQGRNVDGVRYFQQGQYPVAIQRFDSALTIDPQNPDSYYNKAAVYPRMGTAHHAQAALTQD